MTRRAFTLIELVIAAAILAVMVVSIYSAFGVGIKAWRMGSEGKDLQKIRIALLRMQKELQSAFFFSGAPFKGISSEIKFLLVVSEENGYRTCAVDYYITGDRDTGPMTLMKRKALFMEDKILEEEKTGEVIFSANSIDFEYAYESKNRPGGLEWEPEWGEFQRKVPSIVKINFDLGTNEDTYHKIIFIPQGTLGRDEK